MINDRQDFTRKYESKAAHMMDDVEAQNQVTSITGTLDVDLLEGPTTRFINAYKIDPAIAEDHNHAHLFLERLQEGEAELKEPELITHSYFSPENNRNLSSEDNTFFAKYHFTKYVLQRMFTENTGRHMLDSGDHYGRGFEARQESDEWKTSDMFTLNHDMTATVNTYQWLADLNELYYHPILTETFWDWAKDRKNEHWLDSAKVWANHYYEKSGASRHFNVRAINTYNYETPLDNILQWIEYPGPGGARWLILQVHNGCDARSGYTVPRIFQLGMSIGPEVVVRASDGEHKWATHNGGYTWDTKDRSIKSLDEMTVVDENTIIAKAKEYFSIEHDSLFEVTNEYLQNVPVPVRQVYRLWRKNEGLTMMTPEERERIAIELATSAGFIYMKRGETKEDTEFISPYTQEPICVE